MNEMDEEFDNELDALCSQINICDEKPAAAQNENVFKKPMYSFNRVQQNRTFNSFQSTQASSALQSQTHQQNRHNPIATVPNRSNQPYGAQRTLNGQPPNQRPDSRSTNTNVNNQLKPNQCLRPAAQSTGFAKPSPPPPFATHNLTNQNPSVPTNPGNANFSNLYKSIVAQNRNKDCYSINKQYIVSSPHRKFQGKAPGQNQPGKPVQQAGYKPKSDYGPQPRAMISSPNGTLRSTQTAGSSQFQGMNRLTNETNRSESLTALN